MSTINLQLSESLQNFVNHQVTELGLSAPEQYVEKLVEEEQKRQLDEYYYKKCQEALASGEPIRITDKNREEFWNNIKADIRQQYLERHGKASV